MKKNIPIIFASFMSLVACTNDMDNVMPNDDITIITASLEEDAPSRTNFTPTGKFFWTTGDLIKIYNTIGSFSEFEVIDGAGSGNATFSGVMSGRSSTCAVYPSEAAGSVSGNILTISMPSTYSYNYTQSDYASIMEPNLNSINVPMVAKINTIGSDNFNFKNIAGVFCFKFKDVPANTAKIVFTANSKINGDFTLDLTVNTPIISTSETVDPVYKSITVCFAPSTVKTDRVVYFPVPCGTYQGFKIEMYDSSNKKTAFMTSDKSKVMDRSKALVYNEISVTTINGGIEDDPSDPYNGHEYVDLGLPSGLKWATCNLGASSQEQCGNYYAWGETKPKSKYTYENYELHDYGFADFYSLSIIDDDNNLTMSYDAANVNWKGNWRMPTIKEAEELKNYCTWTWTTAEGTWDGSYGYSVKGPNGKTILLPDTDSMYNDNDFYMPLKPGSGGSYWCATIGGESYEADILRFDSSSVSLCLSNQYFGLSIRPVAK